MVLVYARDRIEQWLGEVQARDGLMNREDVCFLMVQTRHLMEMAGSKNAHTVANFYANWVVHPAIDASSVGYEILRELTRVLCENFTSTQADVGAKTSRVIGLPALRSELTDLFTLNGLPTDIFDYLANWRDFVASLLWLVRDQPIRFPSEPKRRTKVRDEATRLPRPHDILVEALAIVDFEGAPYWSLTVSGDKGITVMGAVEIGEPQSAFKYPSA